MVFDKSKVYTALNADELKVGSKVILSDSLEGLREYVEEDNYNAMDILEEIKGEDFIARFFDGIASWNLAYLVEEPEEKKLKWTDLKVGDIIRNNKEHRTAMVVQIDEEDDCTDFHILAGGEWLGDEDFDDWEKVED